MTRSVGMLLLCLLGAHAIAGPFDHPVRTDTGAITGAQAAPGIHAFLGVPFASPPVGALRWRLPQEPKHWHGVRKAVAFAPACAQGGRLPQMPATAPQPAASEDCLYLNLWTPATDARAKLPVLVWIYGGGFQWGYAGDPRFVGEHLAGKGVVLVTIAYRVGALGFLVHPELTTESPVHASGNYGILDQIAALTWIRSNIASFGGDPANVTIFGESAGSTSVNILQASPLARNLFHRVIGESTSQMDSAAGLLGRQTFGQAEQAGVAYQEALGAHSLADMRALPVAKVVSSALQFWPIERDGYVLPLDVYTTFATGRQNPADIIVGANADEGAVLRQDWIKPRTPEERTAFADLYGVEPEPTRTSDTDAVLWQMWSWAALNAQMRGQRSYLYWFSHWPPHADGERARLAGPVHGAEIPYVFDNLDARAGAPWTAVDRQLAETMSSYWTNFAKFGDPNGDHLATWPVLEAHDPQVMEFADTPAPIAMPRQAKVKFLDSYFARGRMEAGQRP